MSSSAKRGMKATWRDCDTVSRGKRYRFLLRYGRRGWSEGPANGDIGYALWRFYFSMSVLALLASFLAWSNVLGKSSSWAWSDVLGESASWACSNVLVLSFG
jgi:hypothetical protein